MKGAVESQVGDSFDKFEVKSYATQVRTLAAERRSCGLRSRRERKGGARERTQGIASLAATSRKLPASVSPAADWRGSTAHLTVTRSLLPP